MLIIEGTSGTGIGKSVAERLGARFISSKCRIFADGESEVLVDEEVKGEDVFIVQSTYPMQDKRLMELFLLANDMMKRGVRSLGVIIPYLAYAREDRKFEGKGNAVSINTVLEILNAVGVSTLVVVAPHKRETLSVFKGRVVIVDAIRLIAERMRGKVDAPFVLAPDEGAAEFAQQAAAVLGCGYAHIDKQRDKHTGSLSIRNAPADNMTGKDVIVIDDMISTGGTIVQAAEFARSKGARSVAAAAVHLIMAGDAYEKMRKSGVSAIYGANTISYGRATCVDVSEEIASAMKGLYQRRA